MLTARCSAASPSPTDRADSRARSTVIIAALISSTVAQAEPALLACNGEMSAVRAGSVVTEKYSLAVTIDLDAGTVKVGNNAPVPIMGDPNDDTVVFIAKPGSNVGLGVSTGSLNRITGVASIHIITATDGLYKFYGTCKPARKLF